jgi:glyoxylase-like metal-dependent hydrolase (beta-lactamase superfamily II)
VLTHAHPDHVQAVPELRERTGAAVIAHEADATWLTNGRVPTEGGSGLGARSFDRLGAARWTPFEVDAKVVDGDLIDGGLRVIHTPGHSPGHIVLWHEPTGAVFVGDAVFNTGKPGLGPAGFAVEPGARASGAARIPRDVTAVGFGHGSALTGADVQRFREFLRTLS